MAQNKHEKMYREKERRHGKATIERSARRNAEGGIDEPGAAPHEQHPRSSPDSKPRRRQMKAVEQDRRSRGRTAKAKSTTRANS